MVHRALVERDLATDTNPYGHGVPDWQTQIEALPCFLIAGSGREIVRADGTKVVDPTRLLVPSACGVLPNDRIAAISDRLGNPILGGPFNVRSTLPHHGHDEIALDRITGGV